MGQRASGRQTYSPSALEEAGSHHESCNQECAQGLSRPWGMLGGMERTLWKAWGGFARNSLDGKLRDGQLQEGSYSWRKGGCFSAPIKQPWKAV